MQTEIAPEVVERMVALVRELHADHIKHGAHDYVQDFVARTAAIVAELPEPVDPDLIEAREIAASWWDTRTSIRDEAGRLRSGDADKDPAVQQALRSLKRGRQLEREGK